MKQTLLLLCATLMLFVATSSTFSASRRGGSILEKANPPQRQSQSVEISKQIAPLRLPERVLSPTANALSGVKRIGAGKDYPTLNAAVADLNVNGVVGPVTFLLTDAVYAEPGMLILPVIGGSDDNSVTIMPDSNTAHVLINVTDNADYGGGIVLSGVSYFTIEGTKKNGVTGSKDLTIQFDPGQTFPTGSLDATIRLREGCSDLAIQDCMVFSIYNTAHTSARAAIVMTTATAANDDITISNNLISRASYGIRTIGGDDFDVRLRITGNQIGGAFLNATGNQTDSIQVCGIYYEFTDSAVISRNHVVGVRRNVAASGGIRTAGIWQNFGVNSDVSYNVVSEIRSSFPTASTSTDTRIYGIRIVGFTAALGGPYPHTSNRVVNNSVSNVYGTGATGFRDFCLSMENAKTDFVYYNSLSMTGTSDGTAVVLQLTGDNTSSGEFTVVNNAMENSRTGMPGNCIYRIFNNSGLPDLTVANHNVLYSPVTSSIDVNGAAWPGWIGAYATHPDSSSSPYNPHFRSATDLHIDSTAASAAMNLGVAIAGVSSDFDGQLRSVLTPTAGFNEVGGISTVTKDIQPVAFVSPSLAGFPVGLPVPSVMVTYRNNVLAAASYTAKVRIFDTLGVEVVGSPFSVAVAAQAAFSFQTVTIPIVFTPATEGFYTFTAIASLAGDPYSNNDTLSGSFLAVPLIPLTSPYATTFETGAEKLGWFGDGDFELADFTKLGGPHSGTNAWVTVAGEPGDTYTEGGVLSHIYSPFFDLTGVAVAYLSFYHSIQTEPMWDRSMMQYTVDSGKTWKQLGSLNDVTGINWYDVRTYNNVIATSDCFDSVTAVQLGYPTGAPGWTSNGDCGGAEVPTGPVGYVYNELKLPAALLGKTYVRFRYVTFSDAATAQDGWAFDDFAIRSTGAIANASVSGMVYLDKNGNGSYDPGSGETPTQGLVVTLVGAITAHETTDVNGHYMFSGLQPGVYTVQEDVIGVGTVVTGPSAGLYSNEGFAPGEVKTGFDFGNFQSLISGTLFDDVNGNASNNTELGISGSEIQLLNASDSTVVQTTVTDSLGYYSFSAPPGSYLISAAHKTGWKQTLPADDGWYGPVLVDTVSGSTTVTGNDFGNFKYGVVRLELDMDINGNGVKDLNDIIALPNGNTAVFTLSRNGLAIKTITIGNSTRVVNLDSLDIGIYRLEETTIPTGWIRTGGGVQGTFTTTVSSGAHSDTTVFLNFALNTVSGIVFNDLNGNGIKDPLEPVLPGNVLKLTGTTTARAVSDSAGAYTFKGVGPGVFVVSESLMVGWRQTHPLANAGYTITMSGAIQQSNHRNNDFGVQSTLAGTPQDGLLPETFALNQNYPNPFNPTTQIRYSLPVQSQVRLTVYNVVGQVMVELFSGVQDAGFKTMTWNASDAPSGIYFYRLTAISMQDPAVQFNEVRKTLLVK